MISPTALKKLAAKHGTPLFVVDHAELRANYAMFKKYLPRVQAYYAVKANSDPAIVKTFYKAGASFDVASMPEFENVYQNIKHLPAKERQDWIWDKIIYANPIKPIETLQRTEPIQAAGHVRQFRGNPENQKIRAAGRPGAAPESAEHRRHGGAVLQVRRVARRSRGHDPRSRPPRA